MDYSIGSSECYISVTQIRNRDEINAALYIPDNKQLYGALYEQKEEIEKAAGIPLAWYELPERKASKMLAGRSAEVGVREIWDELFDWLLGVMVKMKWAFKIYF